MKNNFVICLFLLTVTFMGCKVNYSFTGASIAPEIKTVSVAFFPNYAPLAQPALSQTFTETLRDIFMSQTNLKLVDKGGHLHFEGEITDYKTQPVAITGNEVAAMNRLTIEVNVRFINTKDPEQNFEQKFTRFEDFDSNQSLNQVEDQLMAEINEQLAQDIFNRSVSDW